MIDASTHKGTVDTATYTLPTPANQVTRLTFNCAFDVRLDSVQVEATYNDSSFDRLVMRLISPSGTVSEIADGSMLTAGGTTSETIVVTSKRFMGEEASGTWTLEYAHAVDMPVAATAGNLRLIVYGEAAEVSQRHVYTDERRRTWQNLASADEREHMLWLDDRDGGQDVVMGSALTQALEVHLGRKGWLLHDGMRSLMTPGTRVENAFGGDGNDVLVGLSDGASLLLGNQGSDVLMGYGYGSQLEGGDDDDWLWLAANTIAKGGEGSDRFMVCGGKGLLTTAASVAALLPDFDPNMDLLISYDPQGHFEVARFDLQGQISGWQPVQDPSYLQVLQAQWQKSARPELLSVGVSGNSLTLDLGLPVWHEGASYPDWTLGGQAPVAASLQGHVLTLQYASAPAGQVLDLSKAALYSPLGLGLAPTRLMLGSGAAEVLSAADSDQPSVLYGGAGNDTLQGGSGNDLLLISTGATTRASGGAGADVFRFGQPLAQGGACTVTDFSLSQGDSLDLDALFAGLAPTVDVLACVSTAQVGTDLLLYINSTGNASAVNSQYSVTLSNYFTTHAVTDHLLARLSSGQTGVMGG